MIDCAHDISGGYYTVIDGITVDLCDHCWQEVFWA